MRTNFTGANNVQLVAGVLYGLRAFFLNYDGTLASPARLGIQWKPGENEAVCPYKGWGHPIGAPVGSIECTCGFYSYHKTGVAQSYYPGPDTGVMGVIEAYGHVTIGNEGMRSSKARVIGLVAPRTRLRRRLKNGDHETLIQNYPDALTFQSVEAAASAFNINGRPKILA